MTTTEQTFVGIKEAATRTGLSMYYLRNGCRAGTLPYIMCGNRYKLNLPALMEQMERESAAQTARG